MSSGYQSGFGNHFSTEAEKGALPIGQNSPQKSPMGLYAEQINASAFTAPRHENQRTWVYRIQPSVTHGSFDEKLYHAAFDEESQNPFVSPKQFRWSALSFEGEKSFLDSLVYIAGNGSAASMTGVGHYMYAATKEVPGEFFYSADGEWVVIPVEGRIHLRTELGLLELAPNEIGIIPRGLRFAVSLPDGKSRGYVCENYGATLRLPDLGPIGANGLANPRDFQTPVAAYEQVQGSFVLKAKFMGSLWQAHIDHSPLDVVAWHGNVYPYKYNLKNFNTINTVSFDHPDPSIFTVLTSPSYKPGTAHMDFVIFPPRWMVAEHTFRPPYFHRNYMSEYMGLIEGVYDAKEEGFAPGGASLHNCMSGHGPDEATFKKASEATLEPHFIKDTMAFMFETQLPMFPGQSAVSSPLNQKEYVECWSGLRPQFDKAKV